MARLPPPIPTGEDFEFSGFPDEAYARAISSRRSNSVFTYLFRLVRICALTCVLGTLVAAVFGWVWLRDIGAFRIEPNRLKAITQYKPADNSVVYDREGKKIGEFFDTYHVFVPFREMPKDLVNAIIAIEDRSFWTHKGYDPKGMLRAALIFLKGGHHEQGASTITQQVVRHFLLPHERTLSRKVLEIALARQLEKQLSKERIFEIYANALFLGNGAYGVGAAAWRYFGKPVRSLDPHESAVIAGLFQSPSRYNPKKFPDRAKARQRQVLTAMAQAGFLSPVKAKEMTNRPLVYKEYRPLNTLIAPYFIDYVKEQVPLLLGEKIATPDNHGLRIYTTLDTKLQGLAEQAVSESSELLNRAGEMATSIREEDGSRHQPKIEAAILATDPATGEILAMVGGRDYNQTEFNRTVQSLRSPGSSFKPIVYSAALAQGKKWSDVVYVSPVTVAGVYRPRGNDEDLLTETTLLRAFYRSMNQPTVELGASVGIEKILDHAKNLGIRSPLKPEAGTMIGGSDVTMLDLSRVYSTFANSGTLVDETAILKITDRSGKVLYQAPEVVMRARRVVSEQHAALMTEGMRMVLIAGTGVKSSALSEMAVGKTGTSNESTDNWFCGYTPALTAIVWVGSDEHTQLPGTSAGNTLALPIWDLFMTKSFTVRPPVPFKKPDGIVSARVHPRYGHKTANGVTMYFMRGQEPPEEPSALENLEEGSGRYRDVFSH